VGDSFYPGGVHGTGDPQWTEKWSDIYAGLPPMPWYSVYGNHDLEASDWRCSCVADSSYCHQVRKHRAVHGNLSWFMPSASYYAQPIPGVPLEIVGLDLNAVDATTICPWVALSGKCTERQCGAVLAHREAEAARLLKERIEANQGGNMLVLSHYPTDYMRNRFPLGISLLDVLRDSRVKIDYFGGHRHATAAHGSNQEGTPIPPNRAWLVGGGGGWACDGQQGFIAGEILADGTVVNVHTIMMDDSECCAAA